MDLTELVLKLDMIGWSGGLTDIPSLAIFLYRQYFIAIDYDSSYTIYFENQPIIKFYNLKDSAESYSKVLIPEILKLWKCRDGVLEGPSLENYEEPDTDWT